MSPRSQTASRPRSICRPACWSWPGSRGGCSVCWGCRRA